ncbi:hypothetical protein IQ238_18020 [Pleurocapsales cyanobacterium LEGE 06147]|nr:hypothetical protein [Pleurocapsales cyanobacterium LEGE 06147]
MNNKAIIFAQHHHRLTKFDALVVTLAIIFTTIMIMSGVDFPQSFSSPDRFTSGNSVIEVGSEN